MKEFNTDLNELLMIVVRFYSSLHTAAELCHNVLFVNLKSVTKTEPNPSEGAAIH